MIFISSFTMIIIFITSFVAGILTVLAPCVLPVLPIILWGTLNESNYKRILIIIISFVISIIVFTFLLKVSTVFISIDQKVRKSISGVILILFGIISLFPSVRDALKSWIGIKTLSGPKNSKSVWWQILLWASLWPIFTTCSPTYTLIIATILPLSLWTGTLSIVLYALGLWLAVGLIAVFGKTLIRKLHIVSDSDGWFKKTLAILIILTGISIMTGIDKRIETAIIDAGWFGVTSFEENLIKNITSQNQNNQTVSIKQSDIIPPVLQNTIPESRKEITTTNHIKKLLSNWWTAPEFIWLQNRINTPGYTSIKELKGKVTIINFRTFECINCIHTLPYTQKLYKKYQSDWLVVIGIHSPEFQSEKKLKNLQSAVDQYNLTYPIVQDNDFLTRKAYNNRYRPAKYVIDKQGNIRYTHFWEGKYEELDAVVDYLLKENN